MYRPGRSLVVRNTTWATRDDLVRPFSVISEIKRESLRSTPAFEGTETLPVPVMDVGRRRRTWVFPFDPYLPGLSRALSIEGARAIAETVVGYPCSVRSSVVVYRPTKRAVVRYLVRPRGRARGESQVLYLKVVRPDDGVRAADSAEALAGLDHRFVLPVSALEPGILIFREVAGSNLRDLLLDRRSTPKLPSLDAIWNVAETLADLEPSAHKRGATPLQRLESARRVLHSTVPHLTHRLDTLEHRIRHRSEGTAETLSVTHGDLHEGQFLIDDSGGISGVLDLDDVGVGDLAMDAANMAAHLLVLTESWPWATVRLEAYRDSWIDSIGKEERIASSDLRAREAIALLQLATGPFRVLDAAWPARTEARVALAERVMG